jgi:hypothetical protein
MDPTMPDRRTLQSSCLCGANRITFANDPIVKFRCHCTDERKLTGAAFALNILFSTDTLTTTSGTLHTWTKKVDSGNEMTNHICADCGSLLYRTSTGYPGKMVIKAGCIDGFDAAEEFVPDVEVFTRSRLSWVPAVEGAKQEVADFS